MKKPIKKTAKTKTLKTPPPWKKPRKRPVKTTAEAMASATAEGRPDAAKSLLESLNSFNRSLDEYAIRQEAAQGVVGQSNCAGVRFDMPVVQSPSEFEGIEVAFTASATAVPKLTKGLQRVKYMLPLFDADLSVFDPWSARLDTSFGSYYLGNPKRIERDLKPGNERIKLDFARLTATKNVRLRTLTVYDVHGEVVAVQQIDAWLEPGGVACFSYTLNV